MVRTVIVALLLVLSVTSCARNTASPFEVMAKMSEDEIVSRVQRASTPGEAHTNLQPLVGKWNVQSKWWQAPGQEPQISKAKADHQWVLGKRFVREEYKGQWAGQPFHGLGTVGYDNVKEEYVSTWMDSMGTGIMTSTGQFVESEKALKMSGQHSCPLSEGNVQNRTVMTIVNDDKLVFEMFSPGPNGKEFKAMELTYDRIG